MSPKYKPLNTAIMNAYSGLPSWLTAMPDLDLNAAIDANIKTDQAMRQENALEDISDYYQESPDISWENSRDDIERILAESGNVNAVINLEKEDRAEEQRQRQDEDKRRKQILEIAKLDPETAKLLWQQEELPGTPNFEKLGTKTIYSGGRQITEHPDGSVTIKQLYETGKAKSPKEYTRFNKDGEAAVFTSQAEAVKAGYPYSSPSAMKQQDAFDKAMEKMVGGAVDEPVVKLRRKK